MLAGFIIPRYMLVYYGSEINGLISSIMQFIAYFNLVEAGISGAAVYALYKPLAARDNSTISTVVSAARKFYMQSGYIFVLLTVVLAAAYPFFIRLSTLTKGEIAILVILLGMNGVAKLLTGAAGDAHLVAHTLALVAAVEDAGGRAVVARGEDALVLDDDGADGASFSGAARPCRDELAHIHKPFIPLVHMPLRTFVSSRI